MLPSKSLGKNDRGEEIFVDDTMVDSLLKDETISEVKKEAEQRARKLSHEEKHILRARCKRDLFFLCFGILGNTRLTENFHGHLCEHIRKTDGDPTARFREYLLARGNFKSTIITIGHTIQIILPYTEEDRKHDNDMTPVQWPMNLGPDARVLIAHETAESAARFLYAITSHFTSNPLLMALFPETVPAYRKSRVNKWELELPRTISGNPEPTVDTFGVGGKSQGRHYNYIKLDDIFGDKARDSEAEATATKEWFDNIQSFFSDFAKDRLDIIGTRYSFDDIYAHAHDKYRQYLVKYIRKIEEFNPRTGKVEVTFPEGFPPETLEIIKKNPRVYNAQYLNDPDSITAGFDTSWLRYFYWLTPNTIAIFTGKTRELISVRDLDICIFIDPGETRTGGFVVTGMDHRRRIFVLASLNLGGIKPPALTDLVFTQVLRWQPRTVAIESDFFMATFQHWWKTEMAVRGRPFHITPVTTKKRTKDDRIDGLANYFASYQIYFNEAQHDLNEEYKRWRKSKDIHILDALAYGPEVWRPGFAPGTRPDSATAAQTDDRDVETGYSQIA